MQRLIYILTPAPLNCQRSASATMLLVMYVSLWSAASAEPMRNLRALGPELSQAPTARPGAFYMVFAIAAITVIGSVLCLFRDIMRHKQYSQFQSLGEERDAAIIKAQTPQKVKREQMPSTESDTASQMPSAIEDHIECLIESVVQLRLPPQLHFARYLESLQCISPLYATLRCLPALVRPVRNFPILRERAAPFSITWLLMISRLVNFIVSVTAVTYLFLANPGVCSIDGSTEETVIYKGNN